MPDRKDKEAPKIVIALGGNALQESGSPATAEAQLEVVRKTCEFLADIIIKPQYSIQGIRLSFTAVRREVNFDEVIVA